MSFKNMRIGSRLLLSFGIPILLLVGAIVLSLVSLVRFGEAQTKLSKAETIRVVAEDMKYQRYLTRFYIRQYVLKLKAPDRKGEATATDALNADIAQISALAGSDSQLSSLITNLKAHSDLVNERNAFQIDAIAKDPTDMLLAFRGKGAPGLSGDVVKSLNDNNITIPQEVALLTQLDQLTSQRVQAAQSAVDQLYKTGLTVGILAAVVASVLGVIIVWLFGRSITVPLARAVSVADAIANNDLSSTITIDSTDEIGKLLGSMQTMQDSLRARVAADKAITADMDRVVSASLAGDLTARIQSDDKSGATKTLSDGINKVGDRMLEIVTQMRETASAVYTAAREIATGNTNLSQRTEEQASSLEETAASMEQLTSTVKQNDENARQANQLAIGASDTATRGGAVVQEVVQTMASINDSARKIVDIIGVIDGIAFQTNILALNAAVEAARAGEQGRGFAVVAGEVRNLAQRSASAAKEIKSLISDSVDKTEAGSRQVDSARKTMSEVVDSVKRVTDIMAEIAAASREQLAGIEQVNAAVMQMDQTTQQNAALVEEAAAAAESLEDQASKMVESVSAFKLGDSGQPQRLVVSPAKPAPTAAVRGRQLVNVTGNGAPALAESKADDESDWETF